MAKKKQVKVQQPVYNDIAEKFVFKELTNDYKTNDILPEDGNCDKCMDGGCIWDLGDYYMCGHCTKKFIKDKSKKKTFKEMLENEPGED